MSLNLEQARPLLEKHAIHELVDPRLSNCYSEPEVHNMLQCASSCIQRDPHSRPRMSQVITKVLENELHFYIVYHKVLRHLLVVSCIELPIRINFHFHYTSSIVSHNFCAMSRFIS
jgi:hypothetical protein